MARRASMLKAEASRRNPASMTSPSRTVVEESAPGRVSLSVGYARSFLPSQHRFLFPCQKFFRHQRRVVVNLLLARQQPHGHLTGGGSFVQFRLFHFRIGKDLFAVVVSPCRGYFPVCRDLLRSIVP